MHVLFAGMTPIHANHVNPHSHAAWEIVYYFTGSGTLTVGDQTLPFCEADIICQPPDIPHSEFSEHGFRNIYLLVEDFKNLSPGIHRFRDNGNQDFYNILNQLYQEYHRKQNFWNRIVDRLFDVLFQYMLAWNTNAAKNPFVEEFERILISNISNSHFNMNEVLHAIPISPDHFRRLFKKETGQAPLEYLMNKRIEYSKQLLENNNMKIKEVSAQSGFNDPYYFSRMFKKTTGLSPANWNRQPPG